MISYYIHKIRLAYLGKLYIAQVLGKSSSLFYQFLISASFLINLVFSFLDRLIIAFPRIVAV